jgi:hypothetical protein
MRRQAPTTNGPIHDHPYTQERDAAVAMYAACLRSIGATQAALRGDSDARSKQQRAEEMFARAEKQYQATYPSEPASWWFVSV